MRMLPTWTVPDRPPPNPDCFVLPSYAVKDRTRPNRPTMAMIDLAYAWWQRFPDAVLIMSTGDNQRLGVTNARVMADYALSLGVPAGNIIEEDRSRNSLENLLYSREIVAARGWQQPTLVCYDLHTRRTLAIADRLGWRGLHWLSARSPGEPAYGWKALQTHSRLTILLYEVGAYAYGRLAGWN